MGAEASSDDRVGSGGGALQALAGRLVELQEGLAVEEALVLVIEELRAADEGEADEEQRIPPPNYDS